MTPNPNPNEPNYPYSGGTDNPGDDTSKAGGPTNVAATETAPPTLAGSWTNGSIPSKSLASSVERHAPLPAGLAQGGTDTVLPAGVQAVPPSNTGGLESAVDRGADPEGLDPIYGTPRESGQDEVAGATETTSGVAPASFPEPNP